MTGFIRRYVLHVEWHPGYRPRLSIRRAPRHGGRVVDGGEPGTWVGCRECSTVGFFFQPDRPYVASNGKPEPFPASPVSPAPDTEETDRG